MSYNLHGFISIGALSSSIANTVSPIGELSTYSRTFAKDVSEYVSAASPNVILNAFSSDQDGQKVTVPNSIVAQVLLMSQWLYTRSVNGGLSEDREDCRQQILMQFGADIEILILGKMVTNNQYWLPEQFVFRLVNEDENIIRLWFADNAFRLQYDLYEIVIPPPFWPLDLAHGSRTSVLEMLEAIEVVSYEARIQEAIDKYPDTIVTGENYDWVDKNDPEITYPTPWMAIVYGPAGNNADIIRQALIDYILENSEYSREEWEKIYPDLFLPTEFYITPVWDRYAIPNENIDNGINSPTLPFRDYMRYCTSTFDGVPVDHIQDFGESSSTFYKSLAFLTVGSHKNRGALYSFNELWGDYINARPTSPDYGRMRPLTQEFIFKFIDVLYAAENYLISGVPIGMSLVERGINRYIAFSFEKILYLVSVKSNVIEDSTTEPVVPPDATSSIYIHVVESTAIVARVYTKVVHSDNTVHWYAFSPNTVVSWNVERFDVDGAVIDTFVTADGKPEQLLFMDNQTPGSLNMTITWDDKSYNQTWNII